MDKNILTIHSLKYDRSIHIEWEAIIIDQTTDYIVTYAKPGRSIIHYGRNTIFHFDTWAVDFFPLNNWFTATKSIKANSLPHYYCNICMPPVLKGNYLSYIDLDLDYINYDGTWTIVDQDEFAENQIKYNYPTDIINRAKNELNKLIELVKNNKKPFDKTFDNYFSSLSSHFHIL